MAMRKNLKIFIIITFFLNSEHTCRLSHSFHRILVSLAPATGLEAETGALPPAGVARGSRRYAPRYSASLRTCSFPDKSTAKKNSFW